MHYSINQGCTTTLYTDITSTAMLYRLLLSPHCHLNACLLVTTQPIVIIKQSIYYNMQFVELPSEHKRSKSNNTHKKLNNNTCGTIRGWATIKIVHVNNTTCTGIVMYCGATQISGVKEQAMQLPDQ